MHPLSGLRMPRKPTRLSNKLGFVYVFRVQSSINGNRVKKNRAEIQLGLLFGLIAKSYFLIVN